MPRRVHYIRVSEIDQARNRQLEASFSADKIFVDKASSSTTMRPELQKMLGYIRAGDSVTVDSFDRLARSCADLYSIIRSIVDKHCTITFQKEHLTFGNEAQTNDISLQMLSSLAQFEQSLSRQRQAEGIAAAKRQGKHLGRPCKLSPEQQQQVLMEHSGGVTISRLAGKYGVSRATIYGVIERAERA